MTSTLSMIDQQSIVSPIHPKMSIISSFVANRGCDSQQPFECSVCWRGFTRKENLKRHATLHLPSQHSNHFPCQWCPATFSRRDLRQRHAKKKHPDRVEKSLRRQYRPRDVCRDVARDDDDDGTTSPEYYSSTASPPAISDGWHESPEGGEAEIQAILQQTIPSEYPPAQESHHLQGRHVGPGTDHSSAPTDIPDDWYPSLSQISTGYSLCFDCVSPFIPFLHRPTFDLSLVPPHLTLSMLSLGYQHGEDPDCDELSGSGEQLSMRCFDKARIELERISQPSNSLSEDLEVAQSLLMLELCAILYICGDYSNIGFEMHHRMVTFARSAGLMTSSNPESAATEDLESLWRQFAASESLKRTILAAHQIDALWYQFLSIPRLISNVEVKHDLPCPTESWMASSAQQWAHRQLITGSSKITYGDAVRAFLAPNSDVGSLPNFDPCGAINIAHFLLSSARELSGWTIMTGRLSLERFEPLKSSLVALEPFVRSKSASPQCCQSISSQAAWEMSMIELPVWWISHTNGVVLGSMDEFLEHATFLAASSEFCPETETAQAIKPHIEWFLRYLDTAGLSASEPPWLVLYAFKAFIIAWQLLDHGLPHAMEVVGIESGGRAEALLWASRTFERRKPRKLVNIILKCLEMLSG